MNAKSCWSDSQISFAWLTVIIIVSRFHEPDNLLRFTLWSEASCHSTCRKSYPWRLRKASQANDRVGQIVTKPPVPSFYRYNRNMTLLSEINSAEQRLPLKTNINKRLPHFLDSMLPGACESRIQKLYSALIMLLCDGIQVDELRATYLPILGSVFRE